MEEKQLDVGRLYGYGVCLVAVLTFLFGCVELTRGILDYREPPYTESYRAGPTLVSFGAYKLELLGRAELDGAGGAVDALLPTDSTFRQMYEAERLYRLAVSHQTSRRRVTVSVVLLGAAVLLFGSHWLWLRRRERPGTTGGT